MSLPKGGITMKKAIIYVRGHNQEMQEILCRLYAKDTDYEVLFTTTNIEDVNYCDCEVLIVTNATRISRDKFVYYKTVNDLKAKGIEFATSHENAIDNISLAMDILR